jgi:hypothetical protein
MDLSPYLETLRRDLAASAAAGGAEIERTAGVLAGALDAAARLCLLEALSDAAAEITTKLETATVDVRLRGREADLVVTETVYAEEAPVAAPPPDPAGDVARMTLRLPESLKEAVERAAATEGISVNAWLVRAIAGSIQGPTSPGPSAAGRRAFGRRVTGYAQA